MSKSNLVLAILATSAAAFLSPVAMAQQAGDLVVRARAVSLDPANEDSIAITDISISKKTIPEVDFTYYFSPSFSAELVLTVPQKHDVSSTTHGGKIGTLKHLPPTLLAQYRFTNLGTGPVTPYVGAGINLTLFSSVNLPAGFDIENRSVGPAYQLGADIALGGAWSLNVDYKKVQIRTDLSSNGSNLGTIKVDPTLIGVGVGYRF
ncbi:OmpW/AlkL family protein [Leptothrix discophora]|uniref:OmpW family outer membrane protein n=1 Tax=Leptothrix discophora TaxID=89 RepID=A0ABT9G7E4_LEPDI|nr:OmpW family outer membrane protein [Leptothrix discophora]MDP4302412.1 OmpW family outer membrane protein [Leptothrix discophora]